MPCYPLTYNVYIFNLMYSVFNNNNNNNNQHYLGRVTHLVTKLSLSVFYTQAVFICMHRIISQECFLPRKSFLDFSTL